MTHWTIRLKAENDRLRAFSNEKVRENDQLKADREYLKNYGHHYRSALKAANELIAYYKTHEEVLRKAIEEDLEIFKEMRFNQYIDASTWATHDKRLKKALEEAKPEGKA